MSTLHYKDYQGSVSFEDGRLVIQILHIEDSISAACNLASEAQATFENLVDDYIETCRAVGKEPAKPFRGTFNVRIGPDLHRRAAIAAADAGETLNAWVAGAAQQRLRRSHPRGRTGGKGVADAE
jgi:predicted HicB family RNase H-like nuclease